ncbi:MAG: DUF1566 domain-containing protein [candidate division Zixibacteria bacterium]|nr:DUF1566 domain-containing protein [candidate division Zixibacteria bacterium]
MKENMLKNSQKSGKIITFYSYKGGVGRSMALANVAWLLADHDYLIGDKSQRRILMVDWDLEAPGLHKFFGLKDEEVTSGVLDLFDYYKEFLGKDVGKIDDGFINLDQFTVPIPKSFINGLPISFIPAGRQDRKYASRVNNFDWQDFYDSYFGDDFINYLKGKFREYADVVLIDSRTGITDIGGICTMQVPDMVALLFTINEQNILGIRKIAKDITLNSTTQTDRENPPDLMLVPSRIDITEKNRNDFWMNKAASLLQNYLPYNFYDKNLKYLKENFIQYRPYYSFGEDLAAKDEDMILKPDLDNLTKNIMLKCDLLYQVEEEKEKYRGFLKYQVEKEKEENWVYKGFQIKKEKDKYRNHVWPKIYEEIYSYKGLSPLDVIARIFGKPVVVIATIIMLTVLSMFSASKLTNKELYIPSIGSQTWKNETALEMIAKLNEWFIFKNRPNELNSLAKIYSNYARTPNEKALAAIGGGVDSVINTFLNYAFIVNSPDPYKFSQTCMLKSINGFRKSDTSEAMSYLIKAYDNNDQYMDSLDASVKFTKVINSIRSKTFYELRTPIIFLNDKETEMIFESTVSYIGNRGIVVPRVLTNYQRESLSADFDSSGVIVSQILTNYDRETIIADFDSGGITISPVLANSDRAAIINDFIIIDSAQVADYSTGLIWYSRGSNCEVNYIEASGIIESFNKNIAHRYQKWRLPTLIEAYSLLKSGANRCSRQIDDKFNKNIETIWTSDKIRNVEDLSLGVWTVNYKKGTAEFHIISPGLTSSERSESGWDFQIDPIMYKENYVLAVRNMPLDMVISGPKKTGF